MENLLEILKSGGYTWIVFFCLAGIMIVTAFAWGWVLGLTQAELDSLNENN